MDGAQVKEQIQRWRTLSIELKDKNTELEKSREALHSLEAEHGTTVQQWDLEKENIRNTINAIMAQVQIKKDELQRIEKESAELRRKVDDRRARNEEHLRVLNKRKETVRAQLKEAEARDATARTRLEEFQRNRDESKQQLLSAIKKLETTAPQELANHQQKTRQIRSQIEELAAAMEAEAKSWALEQALREWNEKADARKWLSEETNAAESGKDAWAEVLQEASNIHVANSLGAINELRSLISV